MSPGEHVEPAAEAHSAAVHKHDFLTSIARTFLESNFALVLIVTAVLIGLAAIVVTPREEDPQIVVPLADVYVNMPGKSAREVERLVSGRLEKLLYQIDGVEYVYSMSSENRAVITVRFYVGQDRERSLVKLFSKINENVDIIPTGVTGWVVKPVEIDDVPIVTFALTSAPEVGAERRPDDYALKRVGEEIVERLSALPGVSRAYVVGGEPRSARIELDPDRMRAYALSPLEIKRALEGANVSLPAGEFASGDAVYRVESGFAIARAESIGGIVVGAFDGRPVFLKDVAEIRDGPREPSNHQRHGWGPAAGFAEPAGFPGEILGRAGRPAIDPARPGESVASVTLAIAKQRGTNAVAVAAATLEEAERLRSEILPHDMRLVVTRNSGLTADGKVNELVEALWAAIVIVIALLTLSLGWREAFIVAVAVPVVFGLTIGVNLLFGYTINRVTLFALILSLGLLVDDPIVDVENIARHFEIRGKATREIVLEAVAEIRPPLISATLAVIVSFLPMFFITGMMGPYMAPMALNVPVAMLMSMVTAFTITPWLAFQTLKKKFSKPHEKHANVADQDDPESIKRTLLYRVFRPLMAPLIGSRASALAFLAAIAALTGLAMGLAALRVVPLKMLPYDNKNEFLIVVDLDEGSTLERTSALAAELEDALQRVPEVIDYTTYVGAAGPMDFNGLVRHYYLRARPHNAEIRVNLAGKKHRAASSHEIALLLHDRLTKIAERRKGRVKIVELPPGPPVLSSLVAEVRGKPDHSYEDLIAAAETVAGRMKAEPGVVDVDDTIEAPAAKLVFAVDQEKGALNGVSAAEIAETLACLLGGADAGGVRDPRERNPLRIELRLPEAIRSSPADLAKASVKGASGRLVPLSELGKWEQTRVDQTIYHKNLERVVYVTAETFGRTPAECVMDISFDRVPRSGERDIAKPQTPPAKRTFLKNGGGPAWSVPEGIDVSFSGEGEWKITIDVFRDLGLAFAAALVMIYVILVMQTNSFLIPLVVMSAIPLTILGVMPGFWLLNHLQASTVGGYANPVLFTATAMIGMIALAGIVTRDAIILVDFIAASVRKGRPLFDAIMESRVVRMRPILLTAGAAMLSSIPITLDPIFSGLAWSLIFGLFASTIFTLFVIPVAYWLIHAGKRPPAPETQAQ